MVNNKEFEKAALDIERAKIFNDLLRGDDVLGAYRRLARLVHPDIVADDKKERATKIFSKLSALYTEFTKGDVKAAVVLGEFVITGPLAKGDICDVYLTESDAHGQTVLKIARTEDDNDLLEREVQALKKMAELKKDDGSLFRYFMQPVKSFKASGRRANVLPYQKGFHSLSEILVQYNVGLDFRHIVWMGNRLFNAIGVLHLNNIVHGAIFPEHLLYHLPTHDMRLVDFCYSSINNEPITTIIKKYRLIYPIEVLRKQKPNVSTDIYMAAQTLKHAAARIPKKFLPLFEWCLAESPKARPHDAWGFADLWKATAEEEYGPPKFVQLTLAVS